MICAAAWRQNGDYYEKNYITYTFIVIDITGVTDNKYNVC